MFFKVCFCLFVLSGVVIIDQCGILHILYFKGGGGFFDLACVWIKIKNIPLGFILIITFPSTFTHSNDQSHRFEKA